MDALKSTTDTGRFINISYSYYYTHIKIAALNAEYLLLNEIIFFYLFEGKTLLHLLQCCSVTDFIYITQAKTGRFNIYFSVHHTSPWAR